MDAAVGRNPIWSLHGTAGQLTCSKLSGEVDAARPHAGLHQAAFDYQQTPCLFLRTIRSPELPTATGRDGDSLWWPLPVADAYVRGDDFVASYRPTDSWPYSPQLYWQARSLSSVEGTLASLSLLVSVQTHLLDTFPKITVASQVPSSELLYISIGENEQAEVEQADHERTVSPTGVTCCALWRLLAAPVSYVEIMSAHDFRHIAFCPGPSGKLFAEWHLFADFLEKGVIRRSRVHAALLPRTNDVELALECCRAAEHCPLPLTT